MLREYPRWMYQHETGKGTIVDTPMDQEKLEAEGWKTTPPGHWTPAIAEPEPAKVESKPAKKAKAPKETE